MKMIIVSGFLFGLFYLNGICQTPSRGFKVIPKFDTWGLAEHYSGDAFAFKGIEVELNSRKKPSVSLELYLNYWKEETFIPGIRFNNFYYQQGIGLRFYPFRNSDQLKWTDGFFAEGSLQFSRQVIQEFWGSGPPLGNKINNWVAWCRSGYQITIIKRLNLGGNLGVGYILNGVRAGFSPNLRFDPRITVGFLISKPE